MAEATYFVYVEALALAQDRAAYVSEFSEPPETDELLAWLARLRLLNGVPFAYLVNDAELIPEESIRFFYLDRNWTDAAIDGALSVGTVTTRDRAQLRSAYDELLGDVDEAERQQFQSLTGSDVTEGEAEVATGFLLRSRAVSGWPGLHVHAYGGPGEVDEIGIMRIERLAPAVLLVLLDGLPGYVTITEPRQGIQFGVENATSNADHRRFRVRADDGTEKKEIDESERLVPFREGSPGVIHWNEMKERVDAHLPGDDTVDAARMALHALRFPFEQDFGARGERPVDGDTFRPSLEDLEILVSSNDTSWIAR